VAGEDRQHLLVREDQRVHEHGDHEDAEDGRMRASLAEPRPEAFQDRLDAGRAGERDPAAESMGGDEGAYRERGEGEIAGGRTYPGEEEASQERADHLRDLHRYRLEGDRGGEAIPAPDDEQPGAAGPEAEH